MDHETPRWRRGRSFKPAAGSEFKNYGTARFGVRWSASDTAQMKLFWYLHTCGGRNVREKIKNGDTVSHHAGRKFSE